MEEEALSLTMEGLILPQRGQAPNFHCLTCGTRMITLTEASRQCGVPAATLYTRMRRKGLTLKEAMEFKRYRRK